MTADVAGSHAQQTDRRDRIIGVTPFGLAEARLVVAVARAGGLGALDLGRDRDAALTALELVDRWWDGPFAVRIGPACPVRPEELPAAARTALVDLPALQEAQPYLPGRCLLVEVVDPDEAHTAVRLGADGLIARGCEAGGRVGDLTTFVLLQRLLGDLGLDRPVWAAGGIGPHTAAAAVAGGAAGVVLDAQFALVQEMDLPAEAARAIGAMAGSQTRLVAGHRVYTHPDLPSFDTDDPAEAAARLGASDLRGQLLPVGQDGALARPLADRYRTAGGVVQAVGEHIDAHLAAAVRAEPLAPGPGSARPVLQGPMTRVSDSAEFAAAVAEGGGVPFLALALMTGEEAGRLLAETARRLGDRPWGVGVLGFVPREVRAAQLEAVRAARPPYALISGGSPAQAAPLEEAGIATYLHVPSPALLERFLDEGARRFVFEGMECGGHVGPLASFPLWEAQVDRLLTFVGEHPDEAARLSVAFAGGVHDARSAAMVAALAGPLADRGVQIRVLMGTAYLFTEEAVATGAIVPGFQQVALECERTVLLETAPGRAARCAQTPYTDAFLRARHDLAASGLPRREVWSRLERHNLGRLRLASRGLRREGEELLEIGDTEQYREGMFMMGQAAGLRSSPTTIAALHEQVSAGATAFLAERARELDPARSAEAPPRPLDVAIVGVGCVLPGARDAEEYWAGVVCGTDAITQVPSGRGGLLPDVPFDARAHGIPPETLGDLAPARLLALEVAARALADAGYADRPFDRSRTAVIFGAGDAHDIRTPHCGTIAGWIAERLDLGGAAYTVGAACASSLAALDAAGKELACGTADLVLCGGTELRAGPPPSGRCAPFDAQTDGAAPSEGVACVVLKRLADAERDGDRIYAVVKAVAAAGDGRRGTGRRAALERAYRAAGISPSRVGLVEAHGTGEATDDRAELAVLTRVFAGTEPGRVTLGSVTSQIGHTGGAAGLAGLIKAARAVHTGVRPGTLHLHAPTPAWDPETSPFSFTATPRPWPADPAERYAGVGGSGAGGVHFHAVLAGYGGAPEPVSGTADWPAELFLIRGADRAEARERLDHLAGLNTGARLRDLARTAAESPAGPVQVALVATDPQDLAAKIEQARRFEAAPGVFPAASQAPGRVAFLFPGQDGRRPGMLADLFVAFPRLQRLLRLVGERCAEAMFPPAAFTAEEDARQREALTDPRIAQPALGVAGIAVHRLLTELGVHPDMAAGYGHGELTALCAAEVFGETDLVELSIARAEAVLRAVADGGDPGAMAAVAASPEAVRDVLETVPRVVVAGYDAPRQVVIAGPGAAVAEAVRALADRGLAAEPLSVACAFHSPPAAGAATGLSVELAGRPLGPPAFPVWSNLTATPYPTSPELLAATLAEQVAAPVRFAEQIEAMYAAGARVFVEAGPGRTLTHLVGQILQGRPHTVVPCDRPLARASHGRGLAGLHGLLLALAELAAAGVAVDPLPLFTGRDTTVLPAAPSARPGWTIDGHRLCAVDDGHPAGGPRQADRAAESGPSPADRDAAVLEYLRTSRELLAAQRDVVLGYLGVPVPQPRKDPPPVSAPTPRVPPPRPVPGDDAPAPDGQTPDQISGVPVGAEGVLAGVSASTAVAYAPGTSHAAAGHRSGPDGRFQTDEDTGTFGAGSDGHPGTGAPGVEAGGRHRANGECETPGAEAGDRLVTDDEGGTSGAGSGDGIETDEAADDAGPGGRVVPDEAPATWDIEDGARFEAGEDAEASDAGPGGPLVTDEAPGMRDTETGARGEASDAGSGGRLVTDEAPGRWGAEPDVRFGAGEGSTAPAARQEVNGELRMPDIRLELNGGYTAGPVTQPLPLAPPPVPVPPSRHVVRLAELAPAVAPVPGPGPLTGRSCLIVDDGLGVTHELTPLLESHGARVRVAAEVDGPADAVIHLAALRPEGPPVLPDVYAGIRKALLGGTSRLLLVTGEGGTFGHDGSPDVVAGAGLRGLARTLALEHPDVLVRAVDLEPACGLRALAERIVAEVMGEPGSGPVVVGYDGRTRRTLTLVPQVLTDEAPLPLDRDGVVLLTAGSWGITAHLTRALALTTGCHLEIIGHAPSPDGAAGPMPGATRRLLTDWEAEAALTGLDEYAASVCHHTLDTSDPQAIRALVEDVQDRHGRLDGVIHIVGTSQARPVRDTTPGAFARAWCAGAGTAMALADAVHGDLGFFVVLGDTAGVLGEHGRAGCAAAGDACDTLARLWRMRLGGRVLVADWDPWADDGMDTFESPRDEGRRGLTPLDPDAAVAALFREIAAGTDPQVVFTGATP